ncbi:MAG: hypothetical protein IPJ69_00725 [Deltaproteobacteria bacterium]|nr:MAG: hypothetical protein IPJ69_00725 [Deltaproteobacteria bacterium]
MNPTTISGIVAQYTQNPGIIPEPYTYTGQQSLAFQGANLTPTEALAVALKTSETNTTSLDHSRSIDEGQILFTK